MPFDTLPEKRYEYSEIKEAKAKVHNKNSKV